MKAHAIYDTGMRIGIIYNNVVSGDKRIDG